MQGVKRPARQERPFNWFIFFASIALTGIGGATAQAKLAQLYPTANPGIAWVVVIGVVAAVCVGLRHGRKVRERQVGAMVAASQRPLPHP